MKKTTLCSALLLLFLSSCNEEPENNEDKLRNFYSWYITVNDTTAGREAVSRDTMEKYCTKAFLKNSYDDTDIDYDPVLSAQDCDKEWVTTLTVTKATQTREKSYRVSFLLDKENKSHNIVVTMGKEKGAWKIDHVQDNE